MSIYSIFSQILSMSFTAGIVILIVLAARLLLKKAPKIFSYALWAVVLFRLLCPVSLPAAVSVFNAFDKSITKVEDIGYTPFINIGDLLQTDSSQVTVLEPNMNGILNTNLVENQTAANEIVSVSEMTPMDFAAYIWLGGMAVMLVYNIVSLTKLRRKLVGAVSSHDNIYLADHIASPFVLGLFHPGIYLPSTLSEQEQNYIIQHEQHHIRRFDHVMKIVAFAALCIHWFNPLVWIAFVLAGNDMEMSCDEAVMKKMENDIRADYSTSLLTLATGKKMIAGTPLAFGGGNTKGRIKNVMKYKKPAFWAGIAAAVCLVIVSTVLIFNPKEETKPAYDILGEFDGVPSITSYAVYKMRTSEKGTSLKSGRFAPELIIYSDRTFEFNYNPVSSDTSRGVYKIEDNILTATNNRTDTYVFEVVDKNVLQFVKNASSDVSDINEEFSIPIVDGAEFELLQSQPTNWNTQPESKINITASERHPNYAAIIHKWDGNVYKYDKDDVLMWSGMSSAGPGPVYVSEGDTIEIEFSETVPEACELTAEIMDESGERVPEDLRKEIPITFENGKGSFVVSKTDMDGWAGEKSVGYRLLCRWGENECEYGFVVYIEE